MDFRFTEEEERWKQEVRDWLDKEIPHDYWGEDAYDGTDESAAESTRFSQQFSKKLAKKGWLGMAYPREWGGGRSIVEQAIFAEEAGYRLAPSVNHGDAIGTGAAVLAYGTEEQKKHFVPPILSSEQTYTLGYTETEAGSDLANLQMRAIPDGDDWVVNGQKIFNQYAHRVNGVWLAVRTDPTARKHRGISIFAVDKEIMEKGVTIRPMWTVSGTRLNEIFFDEVRIPNFNMIGEPNQAWYGAMNNTKYTSVAEYFSTVMATKRHFDELVKLCQETKRNGQPLSKDPLVRHYLAEFAASIGIQTALWWREIWELVKREKTGVTEAPKGGGIQPLAGQGTVLWHKEFDPYFEDMIFQFLGLFGQLRPGSKWASLAGAFEREWRRRPKNHAHGSPEIVRMVLATAGLGLPRR